MNTLICPACGTENIEGADRCENCMTGLRNLDVPSAEATSGIVRSVMESKLNQLPQENVLTVETAATVFDAARQMTEAKQTCALVIENETLVGIISETEIVTAVRDSGNKREPIGDVMTLAPETLSESDTIAAALNKMAFDRVRHVPVLKDDGSYTMLSTATVLRHIAGENW